MAGIKKESQNNGMSGTDHLYGLWDEHDDKVDYT
jgi:hypothetical protein